VRPPDEERQREADERGAEGGDDHPEQEAAAAQELVERAPIDRDEQHRGQRKRVDEAVERLARARRDQAEATGEHSASNEREHRERGT
jgi:hypothetical protein